MTQDANRTIQEPHNCEASMTALHGDLTSGYWQDGTVRSCSCGKEWEHVCDEAEGCCWIPRLMPLQKARVYRNVAGRLRSDGRTADADRLDEFARDAGRGAVIDGDAS